MKMCVVVNTRVVWCDVICDEFEINRLGKLMFRTVVNIFFLEGQMDGRTDGQRE